MRQKQSHEVLWQRAKHYASKRGFGADAEDFAQEFVLQSHINEQARLDWIFTDYIRRTYGDTRTIGGKQRSVGYFKSVSLDSPRDGETEDSESLHSVIGSSDSSPEFKCVDIRIDELIGNLSGRRKTIIEGMLMGLTNREMAKVESVSESRISQLVSSYKDLLQVLHVVPDKLKPWVLKFAFRGE